MASSAHVDMDMDPHTMRMEDFKNPMEAFFWLGYHSGSRMKAKEQTPPSTAVNEPVQTEADTEEPRKKPLCEIAEFCTFDCETSGLSSHDVAVQVALGLFDSEGRALAFYDKLWKLPPGRRINPRAYKVHKISERDVREKGYDAKPELHKLNRIFSTMKKRKKKIVAHSAAFDCRILKQSAEQHGVEKWDLQPEDVFCTMRKSKVFCGLTSKVTGKPKCPTNAELFEILTGSAPTGTLHDALTDVKTTARSYVEGLRRHWW